MLAWRAFSSQKTSPFLCCAAAGWVSGCQRWHQDRQAPGEGPRSPSLTSSPAYDCQPRRAPRCSASSAYNQPSTPHKGTRPLGNGSPVPAGSNAVCPLEQLNIYIDVAFPSPSAPVALSSDLSVYAWIHPSDYDSEKKRKRKEKKKRTHVS